MRHRRLNSKKAVVSELLDHYGMGLCFLGSRREKQLARAAQKYFGSVKAATSAANAEVDQRLDAISEQLPRLRGARRYELDTEYLEDMREELRFRKWSTSVGFVSDYYWRVPQFELGHYPGTDARTRAFVKRFADKVERDIKHGTVNVLYHRGKSVTVPTLDVRGNSFHLSARLGARARKKHIRPEITVDIEPIHTAWPSKKSKNDPIYFSSVTVQAMTLTKAVLEEIESAYKELLNGRRPSWSKIHLYRYFGDDVYMFKDPEEQYSQLENWLSHTAWFALNRQRYHDVLALGQLAYRALDRNEASILKKLTELAEQDLQSE
ncbi:MAG: hypothetical protein ACE5J7_03490 [Candidatus Aenigmatarchaeota archaeon]